MNASIRQSLRFTGAFFVDMANENNLNPPIRSAREAREKGQKGGIASGEARRKKKTIRETLEMMLSGQMPDGSTRRDAIVVALMEKALSGDVRAFEAIRDSVGEKPTEKMNVSTAGSVVFPTSILLVAGEPGKNTDTPEADTGV